MTERRKNYHKSKDTTLISVRLSAEVENGLNKIMRARNLSSIPEALLTAISHEVFFVDELSEGWIVLLHRGSQTKEVVWPQGTKEAAD